VSYASACILLLYVLLLFSSSTSFFLLVYVPDKGRNSYSVVQGIPLTMLSNTSSDFDLTIRQQPDRARVAGGKEKGTSH
jgi:hypothetical protein